MVNNATACIGTSGSLILRLCCSCRRITISDIHPGNKLYFDARPLPGKSICNLCALFRAFYSDHVENDFRYLASPPNTELRKTTPEHSIRVEIKNIKFRTNLIEKPLCNLFVAETSIADTWYGNELRKELYFHDCHSVDDCRLGRHSTTNVDHGALSTWADLALARSWIQKCDTEHQDCLPIVTAGIAETLHPSTRLIDTQLERLVLLEEIITAPLKYLALSYVWGNDYQLRTTSQNIQEFRTRLPSGNGDATPRLPRTIRDAMQVTQALGYRFLWVDALCILQDSPADLSIQLAQMDRIYGLAAVTIVARGSKSSDSGLSGVSVPRNRIRSVNVASMVNSGLSVGHWHPMKGGDEEYDEKYEELADRGCYMWRGWTFQEQILSTRTLEFNRRRLLFWCGRAKPSSECGNAHDAGMRDPHHFRQAVRKYQQTKGADLADTQPPEKYMTYDMLISRWGTIRENYSIRYFTYPDDRRNAMLGTATMLRTVVGNIDSSGHVTNHLYEELLWFMTLHPGWNPAQAPTIKFSPDPAPKGMFPSWSWLSLWPVNWPAMSEPFPGVVMRVLDSGGTCILEIEGPTLELKLVDAGDSAAPKQRLDYEDGTMTNIELWLDGPTPAGTIATCAPLALTIFDHGSYYGWDYGMLLLRFVGPHYVRIGIGSVRKDDSEVFIRRIMSDETRRSLIICH